MTTDALDQALEPSDIVEGLRARGVTQADVARALSITDRAVGGWQQHSATPRHYEVLTDLRHIVLLLADSLTPRGTKQWLHARNRLLNGQRPLDALAQGQSAQVIAAAAAFDEGVYV